MPFFISGICLIRCLLRKKRERERDSYRFQWKNFCQMDIKNPNIPEEEPGRCVQLTTRGFCADPTSGSASLPCTPWWQMLQRCGWIQPYNYSSHFVGFGRAGQTQMHLLQDAWCQLLRQTEILQNAPKWKVLAYCVSVKSTELCALLLKSDPYS